MSKRQGLLMLDMFMFARLCVPEANDWRSSVDVNCHNWPIIGYTRKRYTVIFTTLSLPSPHAIFAYFFSTRFPQTFPTILEPGTGYLSISLIFRHPRSFAVPSLRFHEPRKAKGPRMTSDKVLSNPALLTRHPLNTDPSLLRVVGLVPRAKESHSLHYLF